MTSDYAIVETGGKQYRVEEGDIFVVDRLAADEGAKVSLRAVMFRDEDNVVLEPKDLEKVKVEAKIAAHERGPKIMVFKYKAKKGYRRRQGHRSELTRLEVTDVKLLSRRPAKPKVAPADAADGATSADAKVAVESSSALEGKAEPKPKAAAGKAEPKPKAAAGKADETAKVAAKSKPPKAQTKADSSADDGAKATDAAKPEAAAGAKPAAKAGGSSKKGSAGSPAKGKAASSKTPTSAEKKET